MVPQLGLVCMTDSDRCRFRTITRTRFLSLPPAEQQATLEELYWSNIHRVQQTLSFCDQNDIRLYRLTSALFPMSDEAPGERVLRGYAA